MRLAGLNVRKDLSTRHRVDLLLDLTCRQVATGDIAMIAVESLYLTALLIAFVGLIALIVLASTIESPPRRFLGNIVILAAIASAASFLLYASTAREDARSVYGAATVRYLRL